MTSIEGFSRYLIYENGDVYSKYLKRNMTTTADNTGYVRLHLRNDKGETKMMLLHRLVALAYIPNPENKPLIDHIDQNKSNNNINNLRWATNSENQQNVKQTYKNNKLGEKYISTFYSKRRNRNYYLFEKTINGVKHSKQFTTLEQAITYKNNYMSNIYNDSNLQTEVQQTA